MTSKRVSTLRMTSLRLDLDLLAGLQQVKERDGIAVTEQVRRAVREWLKQRGIGETGSRRARAKGRT